MITAPTAPNPEMVTPHMGTAVQKAEERKAVGLHPLVADLGAVDVEHLHLPR